jgi:hypothetical protein
MWCCCIKYALMLLPLLVNAQVPYLGGIANGNSHVNAIGKPMGLTDSLYNGGTANGFGSVAAAWNLMGFTDSVYNGGETNGFAKTAIQPMTLYISDSLYSGGPGNGFIKTLPLQAALHISDSLYNGGTGKGFTLVITNVTLYGLDSLYKGGTGKGEDEWKGYWLNLGICSDTLVWNGNYSVAWGDAANWDCGIVPTITSTVYIPAGLLRYPIVLSAVEIKKLIMQNGASILIQTGTNFKLNGQ